MHPDDAAFLGALLGAISDEVRRLQADADLRESWWQGEALRFPLATPKPGLPEGKWVELRVLDVAEVVNAGLRDRENRGYNGD